MSNTTPIDYSILAARRISPLRQRMIDDMTVRNFAPNTMLAYLKQVTYFAQHFGKSPERLGPEEIRSYQIYLVKERKVSVSSRTVATSALRFLYAVTLKQDRRSLGISCAQMRTRALHAMSSVSSGTRATTTNHSRISSPRSHETPLAPQSDALRQSTGSHPRTQPSRRSSCSPMTET
jgi:hypothetical protein